MLLLLVQSKIFHNDSSYFDNLTQTNIWLIQHNIVGLPRFFAGLVRNMQLEGLTYLLFFLLVTFAVRGFYLAIRRRITIWNVFVPVYLVIVFLWPAYQGGRFFIPLIPLLMYYILIGIKQMWEPLKAYKVLVIIGLVSLLSWSYIGQYNTLRENFNDLGVRSKQASSLFEYIKHNTQPQDRFVFYKPRILALMTGRAGFATHTPGDLSQVWPYWQQEGVNFVIAAHNSTDDYHFLRKLYLTFPESFQSVFKNEDFGDVCDYSVKYF